MVVFLNGAFVPQDEARVSVFDRGFLFGDGVYEVIPVYSGVPFRLSAHLKRLENSLTAIQLQNPMEEIDWVNAIRTLIQRNEGSDLMVYVQVTRGGVFPRNHAFPDEVVPTVLMTASELPPVDSEILESGVKARTMIDNRWLHCNIKATSLLGNVLLKQAAVEVGAYEAILLRDDFVTEGAVSNVFVVQSGEVLAPPLSPSILPGITRSVVLSLAAKAGMSVRETRIPATLLRQADEIWLTSSTKGVIPVTRLDGKAVGSGKPGPVWKQMSQLYDDAVALLENRTLTGG